MCCLEGPRVVGATLGGGRHPLLLLLHRPDSGCIIIPIDKDTDLKTSQGQTSFEH